MKVKNNLFSFPLIEPSRITKSHNKEEDYVKENNQRIKRNYWVRKSNKKKIIASIRNKNNEL